MTWGPDGPVVTAPDRVAVPVWELFGMRRVPGDPRAVELPGGVRYLVGAAHRRWPGAVYLHRMPQERPDGVLSDGPPAESLPRDGVLAGRSFDQLGDHVVQGWATGPVGVGPFPGHQAAMRPQNGGRGEQAVAAQDRGRCRIWVANWAGLARCRCGVGLVLRGTAISWRRTSSSLSLTDVVRWSRLSPLRGRLKIR